MKNTATLITFSPAGTGHAINLGLTIQQPGLRRGGAAEGHLVDRVGYGVEKIRAHGHINARDRGEADVCDLVRVIVEVSQKIVDRGRQRLCPAVQVHGARFVQHQRHDQLGARRLGAGTNLQRLKPRQQAEKNVLIVAVALTFTTALLLASAVTETLNTGGLKSRPLPDP